VPGLGRALPGIGQVHGRRRPRTPLRTGAGDVLANFLPNDFDDVIILTPISIPSGLESSGLVERSGRSQVIVVPGPGERVVIVPGSFASDGQAAGSSSVILLAAGSGGDHVALISVYLIGARRVGAGPCSKT